MLEAAEVEGCAAELFELAVESAGRTDGRTGAVEERKEVVDACVSGADGAMWLDERVWEADV